MSLSDWLNASSNVVHKDTDVHYLEKLPELNELPLSNYLSNTNRLDRLPVKDREFFISYVISKIEELTGRYSCQVGDERTSANCRGEFRIAWWIGALCDLSPRQIINTLYDATIKGLVDEITNPIKFHARSKYLN